MERMAAIPSMVKETTAGYINWVGAEPRASRTASALAVASGCARSLTPGTRETNTSTVMIRANASLIVTYQ